MLNRNDTNHIQNLKYYAEYETDTSTSPLHTNTRLVHSINISTYYWYQIYQTFITSNCCIISFRERNVSVAVPNPVTNKPLITSEMAKKPPQMPMQPLMPSQMPKQPLMPPQMPKQPLMPPQIPKNPLMPQQIPEKPLMPAQLSRKPPLISSPQVAKKPSHMCKQPLVPPTPQSRVNQVRAMTETTVTYANTHLIASSYSQRGNHWFL